jgi:hypothetical protein
MTTRRPPISLHIERLVVDGLPLTAAQATRMQASLERELARLIAQGGDASAWAGAGAAQPAALAAPAVRWDATRPHQLGRALARDVFASLNGPPSGSAPHAPAPQALEPRGRS